MAKARKHWVALLLAASAWGQTRLAWRQLAPGGTQPRAGWQSRLGGPSISQLQAPPGVVTVAVAGSVLQVDGVARCAVTMRRNFSGLVQVVVYSGRVAIMAGHYTGKGYESTPEHVDITGPCIPLDSDAGRYPKGIHAFVYFASVGQPSGTAPLRGVAAPFMPVSYNMSMSGLQGVTGYSGQTVEWVAPPGTLRNMWFQGVVVVHPMGR